MCYFMHFLLNATGGEEMLIAPIMSIYRLPQGQYGYGGKVINLPQDVASYTRRIPRLSSELDIDPYGEKARCQSLTSGLSCVQSCS